MLKNFSVGALILFALVSSARGDTAIDKAIWIGNAVDKIDRTENPAYWTALAIVAHCDPDATADSLRYGFNTLRWHAEIDAATLRPEMRDKDADFANSTYEALKSFPGGVIGSYLQYELKNNTDSFSYQVKRLSEHNRDFYALYGTPKLHYGDILARIYALGQAHPQFARVFDEVFGVPLLNSTIGEPGKKILQSNPTFAAATGLKDVKLQIAQFGSSLEEWKAQIEHRLTAVANPPTSTQSPTQNDQSTSGIEAQRQHAHDSLQKAKQDALELKGLRSSVYVLSELFPHSRDAAAFRAIANGIISTRALQIQYIDAYGNEPSTVFDSSLMAFSYFGIFMSVIEAISSDNSPSNDQIIIDDIKALAHEIQTFQEENRVRFDRLDHHLALSFAVMVSEFSNIAASIDHATFSIDQTRSALAATLSRLDEIDHRDNRYLKILADGPFERSMVKCLGFEERTGRLLEEDAYDDCASSILSFVAQAPERSRNGLHEPGDFEHNGGASGWMEQVNTFLSIATKHGGYWFSNQLANPAEWAEAADAYVALATGNLGLFRKLPLTTLNSIAEYGQQIDSTISKGFPAEPVKYLDTLTYLLTDYRKKIQRVKDAAARVTEDAIHGEATYTWLSPEELQSIIVRNKIKIEERPVSFVGSWRKFATVQPKLPFGGNDIILRGEGRAKFDALKYGHAVWDAALADPYLIANEFLGRGRLELRYSVDVSDITTRARGLWWNFWGRPFASVFGYLVPAGSAVPGDPVALIPYRMGNDTIVWDGVGSTGAETESLRPSDPPGRWGFYWEKFLNQPAAISLQFVALNPSIKDNTKLTLDKLLVLQQAALINAAYDGGSEFALSVADANEAVESIREFIAMTLPGPYRYNGALRSTLTGLPSSVGCLYRGASRIVDDAQADNHTVVPQLATYPLWPFVKQWFDRKKDNGKSRIGTGKNAADGNPICSQFQPSFGYLLDTSALHALLHRSVGKEGNVHAGLINATTMMRSIDRFANEGAERLVSEVKEALSTVSYEQNRHPFIVYQLSRLKDLKKLHESSVHNSLPAWLRALMSL